MHEKSGVTHRPHRSRDSYIYIHTSIVECVHRPLFHKLCVKYTRSPHLPNTVALSPKSALRATINVEDHQHHISENQHIPKLISKVYKKKSTDKRLIPCSNDRQHKAPYPAVSAHRSSKFIQRAYPFSQIITDLFAKHQCGILPPHPSHLLATSHENM